MLCKEVVLWIFNLPNKIYLYFVDFYVKKFIKNDMLDEACLEFTRGSARDGGYLEKKNWYRDEFYFGEPISIDRKMIHPHTPATAPKYFSLKSGKALKIIYNRNSGNVFTPILFVYISIYVFIGDFFGSSLYNISYCGHDCRYAINVMFAGVLLCFHWGISFWYFSLIRATLSFPALRFPYMIFDNAMKSIIIRGKGQDEVISYDRLSFNLLPVMDSPAYCAIEMNVANEEGAAPRSIIMDFCESHNQAKTILKTYFLILEGDENIFYRKLKRHPVNMKEFYLPFAYSIWHFILCTFDKFWCVFPHYLSFRLVYGNPMGVLKQYIHEQEYLRPKEIPGMPPIAS